MLTGNILLLVIVSLLAILMVGGGLIAYRLLPSSKKEKGSIIEVDAVDPDMTQGYGFIVDQRVVLSFDNKPLLFENEEVAKECLIDRFNGAGEIVYQKWDVEKQQLILGKVVYSGTN